MSEYDKMSDKEAIALIMKRHGCDEAEANFILAIETGQISGDVVMVDENGVEHELPMGKSIVPLGEK